MKVAITGGSSALGKEIIRQLRESQHEVVRFGRQTGFNLDDIYFNLNHTQHSELIREMDCVIHCAWDLSNLSAPDINSNVIGTKSLLNQTRDNAQFIFISTLSAFNEDSVYGQLKRECEKHVLSAGGLVIRCGIIWGEQESGILSVIRKISKYPLFCLHIFPEITLFQSRDQDIAKLVSSKLAKNTSTLLVAANSEPFTLSDLFHAINTKVIHLRMNIKIIGAMLKLFQNVGLFLNMRIDSLKGDLTNHKDEITSLSRGTGSDFTGNREFFAQMKRGQQNT